jgi:hypothetical protein
VSALATGKGKAPVRVLVREQVKQARVPVGMDMVQALVVTAPEVPVVPVGGMDRGTVPAIAMVMAPDRVGVTVTVTGPVTVKATTGLVRVTDPVMGVLKNR